MKIKEKAKSFWMKNEAEIITTILTFGGIVATGISCLGMGYSIGY